MMSRVARFTMFCAISLFMAVGIALVHASTAQADTIDVGGVITTSTTWASGNIYVIQDQDLTINYGVTLTVQPGTFVKFNGDGPGGEFTTRHQRNLFVDGRLLALGTADNPIFFTSLRDDSVGGDTNGDGADTTPEPGNWGRVEFRNTSTGSILDHVVVRFAGTTDYQENGGIDYYGAVTIVDTSPTLSNSMILNNARWGVYCSKSVALTVRPTLQDNIMSGNAYYGVSVDTGCLPIVSGNTFTGNGGNGMEVRGGTVLANTTWDQTSVTYAIEGDVTVGTGITLTISPGLVIKFDGDGPGGEFTTRHQRNLFVDGRLLALGTADSPIYFTSLRDDSVGGDTNGDGAGTTPEAGNWGRMEFRNTQTGSQLGYTIIRYAGTTDYQENGGINQYPAVTLTNSAMTIANSTVSDNAQNGIDIVGSAQLTLVNCNAIERNAQYGLINETAQTVDARNNWWGSASGPNHPVSNPNGTGNQVSDNVLFNPWQTLSCGALPVHRLYLPLVRRL